MADAVVETTSGDDEVLNRPTTTLPSCSVLAMTWSVPALAIREAAMPSWSTASTRRFLR
jgi:hypothetical protein